LPGLGEEEKGRRGEGEKGRRGAVNERVIVEDPARSLN
jgi:hypothetical protein